MLKKYTEITELKISLQIFHFSSMLFPGLLRLFASSGEWHFNPIFFQYYFPREHRWCHRKSNQLY